MQKAIEEFRLSPHGLFSCFLLEPKTTSPWMALPTMDWAQYPTGITTLQAYEGIFSVEALSSDDSIIVKLTRN